MRKLALMLAQCLLLAGCTGLPQPREMGEMALLRTVGVDMGADAVRVTVSTGPRASGVEGEKQSPLVLEGEGLSLAAASMQLRQKSDRYVFFGYVDKLLLGGDPGRIGDVLSWFAQDGELGLGADVWLVRAADAGAAVDSGGEAGVESRLAALKLDGKLGAAPMTRTAGEVLIALLDRNCAFLPALTVGEGLEPAGYGVLRGNQLAGYLDGDAARGLELLAEHPIADIIEVSLPNNRVSLRLTGAQLDCRPVFREGELVRLELVSRVEGVAEQWNVRPDSAQREELQSAAQEQLKEKILQTLAVLRGWRTDCVGLGSRVAIAAPWHWDALEADWPEVFSRVACDLTVELSLGGYR